MTRLFLAIGGLCFCFETQEALRDEKDFSPFVSDRKKADISVTVQKDETVETFERCCAPDYSRIVLSYNPAFAREFISLRGCLMHLPVEKIFLLHDRFFLHASLISSPWGGLLFSGDSGAGKSTQAELWREHMGSIVINGDRAIVAKERGGWRAYGSPYAGSSGYFIQRNERICTVIFPEKSQTNQIDSVSDAEAFRRMMRQITFDYSRADDVGRLCELVTELIASVPVCRLRCTPDVRAVETLRDELRNMDRPGALSHRYPDT